MGSARRGPGYLLMPRPLDSLVKSPYVPVTYAWAIGSAGSGEPVGLAALVVAWAAVDLLLYPARYAVNDLLDRTADSGHPGARQRGRVPDGLPTGAVLAMVGVRCAGMAACVVLVGHGAGDRLLVAAGATVAVSAVYESLRWWTGRRPAAGGPAAGPRAARLIWLWVGAGYGVRMGLGASLGGARPAVVLAAGLAGWTFGCMFVVQSWSLEAAGLRRHRADDQLAAKPHVAALVPEDDPPWYVLRQGVPAQRSAAFALVAVVAATVLTVLLAPSASRGMITALVVLTALGGIVVARADERAWPGLAGLGLVALCLLGVGDVVTADRWERAGPLLIVLVTGTVFWRAGPGLVGIDRPPSDTAPATAPSPVPS